MTEPTSNGDQREFVDQWRDNAYGCFSSGAQVLPRGLPRDAGHAQREPHADLLPREHRRDGAGAPSTSPTWPTTSSTAPNAGAGQLRCPNTLMTGDFYRHRTRTVDVVKAMRALMVATGNEREGWRIWNERLAVAPQRARARRRAVVLPGARGRLGAGASTSRWAARRSCSWTARRPSTAPSYTRAFAQLLQTRRRRVRPDARAVVLRRARGGDGLRRPGARARGAQRGRLAGGRRNAHHRSLPARLHRLHRGLPALLRRRLRVRDRPRGRAGRRAGGATAGSS